MKLSNLGNEISQIESQFNCSVKIAISSSHQTTLQINHMICTEIF